MNAMNKYIRTLLFSLLLLLLGISSHAQVEILTPNDTTICNGASSTLRARVNGRIPIPFVLNQDDVYSSVINLGFSFDFYGNTYTQCVISSNGFISFDLNNANQFSQWDITSGVPGNTNCLNAIMAAYSDINPGVTGGTIDYSQMGVAPNRLFIVSFCNVPM